MAGLIGAGGDRLLPGAARVPGAAADRAAGGDAPARRRRWSRSFMRQPIARRRSWRRPRGRGSRSGSLFGLLALVRPEYLLAGAGPAAGLARHGRRSAGGDCARAVAPAGVSLLATARRPRALDDPQRRRARPLRADLDRRRQGALHRHLPGRRRRRPEAARSCCSPNGRRCARGSTPAGRSTTPTGCVLERVLARVAAERYPGLETDAALGRLGRAEPRRRRHRRAAALRRDARSTSPTKPGPTRPAAVMRDRALAGAAARRSSSSPWPASRPRLAAAPLRGARRSASSSST